MKTYKIAVIPGDGIGPEVIREGLKVLDAGAKRFQFKLEKQIFNFGAENYLKTGETLPESFIEEVKNFQAVYLGAIGHPAVKPGILERGILLKLRFDLDLYINLRPVKLYEGVETCLKNKTPEDIDYIVIRENTGDVYTGVGEFKNKGTPDEIAVQSMIYTRKQVERCLRFAFHYCRVRHKNSSWRGLSNEDKKNGFTGKCTLCGKTNVLTYVYDLWDRTFHEVAKDFPEIKIDYVHVDAMCIFMLENPERFDVIVTGNMFGDIITDLAAVTQGGMGLAPSANINPQGVSLFEPVHGTAPQFAGQNIVNPIAAIATAVLMLNHWGEKEAAQSIENAIKKNIKKMKSMLAGKMGYTTSEVGDMIANSL